MKRSLILALSLLTLSASLFMPNVSFGSGNLNLSQTSINLNVGQTVTVTATPPAGQIVNVFSLSNTAVAQVNAYNNVITVYGSTTGSTNALLCTFDNTCATLYISVGGNDNGNGGNYGQITFSQNNVSLNVNQSSSVSIYNSGTGSNYISSNSNSSVVSASVSGNSVNLFAQNAGSSTIVVCGNNASCGSLFVSVINNTPQISLSQTSITLNNQDAALVTVYSTSNLQAYISSNSNPNVVSATINNNVISVRGLSNGTATVVVCVSNSSTCANLYVTTNGQNFGTISFNPSTVSLYTGQATTVSIINSNYYNQSYYISSNSNPSVITASVASSLLYITATNAGTSNVTVCQTAGSCSTLYVTVLNSNNNSGLTFTAPRLPTLVLNQYYSTRLAVTGGSYPYTFYITAGSLPQGLYLTNDGQIYGTPVNSNTTSFTIQVRDNLGRTASQSFIISSGSVLGAQTYANGTLVNDAGTVYLTYKNTRSPFASLAAFQGLGYKLSNVITGSTAGMNDSGYIITSSTIAHPWGSWIRSGQTIYFVSEFGLIPIPTYDIFINNGGRDALVVNVNGYDFGKSVLPVLGYNDTRLR